MEMSNFILPTQQFNTNEEAKSVAECRAKYESNGSFRAFEQYIDHFIYFIFGRR
jgi:hypothetical protein